MHKTYALFLLLALSPTGAISQSWLDNTEGVGAAAMGRGGASIAVATDATVVWWNPAGLAMLTRTEATLGIDAYQESWDPHEDVVTNWGETHHSYTQDEHFESDHTGLAYLAIEHPMKLGTKDAVLWAGYRRMASFPDMDKKWTIIDEYYSNSRTYYSRDNNSGGMDDYGVAIATTLHPRVALGAHIHWLNTNVTNDTTLTSSLHPETNFRTARHYEFASLLWDLGLDYAPIDTLHIGITYHSGSDTGMDYSTIQEGGTPNPSPAPDTPPSTGRTVGDLAPPGAPSHRSSSPSTTPPPTGAMQSCITLTWAPMM